MLAGGLHGGQFVHMVKKKITAKRKPLQHAIDYSSTDLQLLIWNWPAGKIQGEMRYIGNSRCLGASVKLMMSIMEFTALSASTVAAESKIQLYSRVQRCDCRVLRKE